ncbi:MAG: hypothetical protein HRT74_01805, partial [Flavobacteriales bacterium]|nr:hypothetical protein [Flavobacteriales bacterium]
MFIRISQRQNEQDSSVQLSLQAENLGCTSPCDGNYDPLATLSDATCLFWIIPWVSPSSLYAGSPFDLSCGNTVSFHSQDTFMGTEFIWRPCFVPDSFAPTSNGLAWGLIENSGGEVSFRATSTDDGFLAHVYQRELEQFEGNDLISIGNLELVANHDGTFVYALDFTMEEGVEYLYAMSVTDDDDSYATIPASDISLSLHGCLSPF